MEAARVPDQQSAAACTAGLVDRVGRDVHTTRTAIVTATRITHAKDFAPEVTFGKRTLSKATETCACPSPGPTNQHHHRAVRGSSAQLSSSCGKQGADASPSLHQTTDEHCSEPTDSCCLEDPNPERGTRRRMRGKNEFEAILTARRPWSDS